MNYLFIGYPRCTTSQKAQRWLDGQGIAYTERNIAAANPSEIELREWVNRSGLPVKRFFNTSGLLYKELKLKEKLPLMSAEEQIQLLATDGMLVKRPLLIGPDFIFVGFDAGRWAELRARG